VFENLIKAAVLTVFKDRLSPTETAEVVSCFEEGIVAQTGSDLASADLAGLLEQVPALREPVRSLTQDDESPAAVAAAVEFVLEGLHLSKRLNKDIAATTATYRSRS
jgi:magnesium chelatase subunit I